MRLSLSDKGGRPSGQEDQMLPRGDSRISGMSGAKAVAKGLLAFTNVTKLCSLYYILMHQEGFHTYSVIQP